MVVFITMGLCICGAIPNLDSAPYEKESPQRTKSESDCGKIIYLFTNVAGRIKQWQMAIAKASEASGGICSGTVFNRVRTIIST